MTAGTVTAGTVTAGTVTAGTLSGPRADRPGAGSAIPPLVGPTMTRVAALDPALLDAMVIPDVGVLLDGLVTARHELEVVAGPLGVALHALVPVLDDDMDLRRRVLAARRALRKGMPTRWERDERARFERRAAPRTVTLMGRWDELVDRRAAAMVELRDAVERHRPRAVDALRSFPATATIMESLAVAAPDWVRHGMRGEREGRMSPRELRTLYSYLLRASVKTSPFSGLTTVGRPGGQRAGRARSRTSLTVARVAVARLARAKDTAPLFTYRVAPLRPGGPTEPDGLVLHAELVVAGGVVWRNDRVVEADHARHWVEALGAPHGPLTYAQVVARIGGADPFRRFTRLLDTGVIHPVLPWTQGEDPLHVLGALVGERDGDVTGADLLAVRDAGAGIAAAAAPARVEATAVIARTATPWFGGLRGGGVGPSGLVYEDRETDLALLDPRTVPSVVDDLHELGGRLRPAVFRSHLYDLLVDGFVAEFGAGGVCTDPLGFLMRQAVDGDSHPALDAALAADMRSRADPGPRAWLPVGRTSAPANAGLLVQIEAHDADDVRSGRYRMVVNQFTAGSGGLLARFTSLLGDGFAADLRAHVAACWPSLPCRELVVWTDCNTAQAECAGLLPPLVLDGDVDRADGLTLDRTVLRHDAVRGTLDLCTADGEPFGLVYLGLIPQYQLQSYVRLLAVLADPWVNVSPLSDHSVTKHCEFLAPGRDAVLAVPRQQVGRVITRRASWIVPTAELPRPGRDRLDDAELLLRVEDFRRRHGMPDELFVHQLGGHGPMGSGDHKPMWVSLRSPQSLAVLDRWIPGEVAHLRMVEVVPTRGSAWQRDAAGARRVTEHAVLLAWPPDGAS